jgi:hypothetical protein
MSCSCWFRGLRNLNDGQGVAVPRERHHFHVGGGFNWAARCFGHGVHAETRASLPKSTDGGLLPLSAPLPVAPTSLWLVLNRPLLAGFDRPLTPPSSITIPIPMNPSSAPFAPLFRKSSRNSSSVAPWNGDSPASAATTARTSTCSPSPAKGGASVPEIRTAKGRPPRKSPTASWGNSSGPASSPSCSA